MFLHTSLRSVTVKFNGPVEPNDYRVTIAPIDEDDLSKGFVVELPVPKVTKALEEAYFVHKGRKIDFSEHPPCADYLALEFHKPPKKAAKKPAKPKKKPVKQGKKTR